MESQKRNIIFIFFTLCATVLLVKAAQLQLFDASNKVKAEDATLSKRVLYPSRGLIYDRDHEIMVINKPSYDLKVVYRELDMDLDTSLLCSFLDISKQEFKKRIEKDWKSPYFSKSVPFTFISNLSPEKFAPLQEHLYKFPGFYAELRNVRGYPHRSSPHILGYISEVTNEVIEKSEGEYHLGDYIGVSGLEKTYEHDLKGKNGLKYILKDNLGRAISDAGNEDLETPAIPGKDLVATVDLDLQEYAEKLLENKLGAVVAIEPETGEILAMVSSKGFDPNLLSINEHRGDAFKALLNDTINRPFMDRTVMAKYPPGSIFKPIISLIALQEGTTYINRTIFCDGEYVVNKRTGFSQGCHQHPVPYNIKQAIQYSCNSYFYQLFRELIDSKGYSTPGVGLSIINTYLDRFGLGRKLNSDIGYESAGFIPTPEYYDRLYSHVVNGWRSTYILSLGIGQGELQLTTLQMANLATILANRGWYKTPHLLKYLEDSEGNHSVPELYLKNDVQIKPEYFEAVVEGLERVVNAGTARLAYIPGIPVCGKTGTSQNPQGKDHSVFFAFAPKDNPKIAIATFVENAGWGGDYAAPISSLIIEKYLTKEIHPSRQWIENRMLDLNLMEP